MDIPIESETLLSSYTTIGLGGCAKYFLKIQSCDQLQEFFSQYKPKKYLVLGGGSNLLIPDTGYDGYVLKLEMLGVEKIFENDTKVGYRVQAGENWDAFVRRTVLDGNFGVECLAGIPGNIGAVPIQNVGAYGQEVADTIVAVKVFDPEEGKFMTMAKQACQFGYRDSYFKHSYGAGLIVCEVEFCLDKAAKAPYKYRDLKDLSAYRTSDNASQYLQNVYDTVIKIRKAKGMVIDKQDPDSRSLGSFFKNPVVDQKAFDRLQEIDPNIPFYEFADKYKIPAAWLIEQAGIQKGLQHGGVGVSHKHSLALINISGTTSELLELAALITKKVDEKFGVVLEREPALVS